MCVFINDQRGEITWSTNFVLFFNYEMFEFKLRMRQIILNDSTV
jgi:hypothetical protein